ncbi:hypothetical protein ATY81_15875 [Rhizobium sp. R72]|nr:hypothetical protein ATY81_15875 [Rhizobium sp. R72]OWV92862.1 hypothetical protein ATY80_15875 [Rhizobium sp. R711]
MKPMGVISSDNKNAFWLDEVIERNVLCARSAALAKPTLTIPIVIASIQKTSLGRHCENDPHRTRDRRRTFDFR